MPTSTATNSIDVPQTIIASSASNHFTNEMITSKDLIDTVITLATVNLGYLAASIATLGIFVGVFIYFNIRPLKEILNKQEKRIDELKKEAQNLLITSKAQAEEIVDAFKAEQDKWFREEILQQEEKMKLEYKNIIQLVEKNLTEKIDEVSENKDLKLKDVVIAEITVMLANVEKNLKLEITNNMQDNQDKISKIVTENSKFKSSISDFDEKIKELQAYRYNKEGRVGSILVTAELLKIAIDNHEKFRKSIPEYNIWKIESRLEELIEDAEKFYMNQKSIDEVEEQLKRIEKISPVEELIKKLRSLMELNPSEK
jgi:hypothetical protein